MALSCNIRISKLFSVGSRLKLAEKCIRKPRKERRLRNARRELDSGKGVYFFAESQGHKAVYSRSQYVARCVENTNLSN